MWMLFLVANFILEGEERLMNFLITFSSFLMVRKVLFWLFVVQTNEIRIIYP